MTVISFTKMHGLGNDFIIIDLRLHPYIISAKAIKKLSDRFIGIGCDQFVTIGESVECDSMVRFYNADGTESGACGNATRCVGFLEMYRTGKNEVLLETIAGILRVESSENGLIKVHMGEARTNWKEIPMLEEVDTLSIDSLEHQKHGVPAAVNIGNPHCIFFVDQFDGVNVEETGREIENHQLFPEKTNVEFVKIISNNEIEMRVWERGVGETKACGTGACAAAFVAFRRGYIGNEVSVKLPGGVLFIEITDNGEILMTGPTKISFTGTFELEEYQ